jgi:hypothetical protein
MRVCIFDAWYPEGQDPSLVNSHWAAQVTIERLCREDAVLEHVSGAEFQRQDVLARLSDITLDGFLFFGHGRAHVLFRDLEDDDPKKPIPLFAIEDLSAVGRRFFATFACWSGLGLATAASASGVGAYLGYREPLRVNWVPERLPDVVRNMLGLLCTEGGYLIASGERSRRVVRARIRTRADEVLEYLDQGDAILDWAEHVGIMMLATDLCEHLVLEGVDVIP